MSNIFKSNSRFAGLTDEIPANKDKKKDKIDRTDKKENMIQDDKVVVKYNSFKDEKPDDRFNSFKNNSSNGFRERRYDERDAQKYREQREAQERNRIEFEEKERERLKQEALKIENFPDLVSPHRIISQDEVKKEMQQSESNINFIEKLKNNDQQIINDNDKYKDPDLENLKEGWVLFRRDPNTRKTIIKRHPKDEEREKLNLKQKEEEEKEIARQICKRLSDLYEKRKNAYIELYGYDTWEKMFKCPGWQEWEAEFDDIDSDEEIENDEYDEYDEYDHYNEY